MSTFNTGVSLLPPGLQGDARHLYHLLRTIDDLVDERHPQAAQRVGAIERWAQGEKPDTPEAAALETLSRRYTLPRDALIAFCKGMNRDIMDHAVNTEADLERYCQEVGGSVGVILAALLGTTCPEGEEKMAVLGTAMQWTNILRDIDEDRSHGRNYLAQTTVERFGAPVPGAREDLLRDQIHRVDSLYGEGLEAIPLLRSGRRAMWLSAVLYREILRQIEREGFGLRAGRVTVPAWRRRLLIADSRWMRRGLIARLQIRP